MGLWCLLDAASTTAGTDARLCARLAITVTGLQLGCRRAELGHHSCRRRLQFEPHHPGAQDAVPRCRDEAPGLRKEAHGYLGSIPEDEDEDNLDDREEISLIAEEDLTEEGMAMWASATEEAETAYAAYQQARRTLREARHKQHAVKMSRQYYKPDTGGRRDDSRIVCMSCGKMGHRKANCPSSTAASSRREPESAPFVCYAGGPEGRAEPESALGTNVPTADAIAQGKCVVDCGATRSIGSIKALEQLMSQNIAKRGNSGVKHVDLQDKPVFNFGNSSENQFFGRVKGVSGHAYWGV